MKMIKQMRFFSTIMMISGFALLTGCSDDEPKREIPKVTTGVYVLNEGLFNQNNTTLTYYDFGTQSAFTDFFLETNERGLGDTGNDLKAYGSKLYAVINGSGQVEIMDLKTSASIKRIAMLDDEDVPRQPRFIAFHKQYAYVCSFDGTVGRLDTATLVFDKFIQAGRQPDGICVANEKLYVSNSGGLDYPDYDNTVSVINTTTFEEIKKITVGVNPYTILADDEGDVYVVSRGNYDDVPASFQRIDAQTDAVSTFDGLEVSKFTIAGDFAYLYNYSYATGEATIKVLNVKTETLVAENFITDGTEIAIPYSINVDPANGDVYIADAAGFTVTGDVHCFSKTGILKFSFEAGLNPNSLVFVQQ
jgi:YVTN family beta-propeller protein